MLAPGPRRLTHEWAGEVIVSRGGLVSGGLWDLRTRNIRNMTDVPGAWGASDPKRSPRSPVAQMRASAWPSVGRSAS